MPLSATDTIPQEPGALRRLARMLWADKFALAAALFVALVVVLAVVGPMWLEGAATRQNLSLIHI